MPARKIILVSVATDPVTVDADQRLAEATLTVLRDVGVTVNVTLETVQHQDAERQVVLVELIEAAAPCDAMPWRSWAGDTSTEDLVIIVGGTIRSTASLSRYVGVTCPPGQTTACLDPGTTASTTILFDRRGVDGAVPTEVILAHELGHAAGLGHSDDPGPGCPREDHATSAGNLMLARLHAGAPSGPDSIHLTSHQRERLGAYLTGVSAPS